MSAHLTVYSMAIAAERPLRLRAAEHERLAAQAEAAASGRDTEPLSRRIGSAHRRSWWGGIAAALREGSAPGRRRVIGQPAG
jgi:hypothetical protein